MWVNETQSSLIPIVFAFIMRGKEEPSSYIELERIISEMEVLAQQKADERMKSSFSGTGTHSGGEISFRNKSRLTRIKDTDLWIKQNVDNSGEIWSRSRTKVDTVKKDLKRKRKSRRIIFSLSDCSLSYSQKMDADSFRRNSAENSRKFVDSEIFQPSRKHKVKKNGSGCSLKHQHNIYRKQQLAEFYGTNAGTPDTPPITTSFTNFEQCRSRLEDCSCISTIPERTSACPRLNGNSRIV